MANYQKSVFTSVYRYEYIEIKSKVNFSIGAGVLGANSTITHNLGYYPYYKLWYTFGGKIYRLFAGPTSFDIDGNLAQIFSISTSTTAITISIDNNSASTISGSIYYRIYAEPQS